jgi:hypothetical protein
MLDWLRTSRLRPALTLLGLAGLLALGACGGGSGAPNNPYVTPPTTPALSVQPATVTAYSGVPLTVTITSGVAPFSAFSSDATVLPVGANVAGNTLVLLPNKVTAVTAVTVTVQDAAGQTVPVSVTINPSSILNALTFAPSGGDCGTDLCSGQTGTATVVATAAGGAPLVGRQIRFDVVFGSFGIATGNPGTPLVQSLTVATDGTGTAVAGIQALANATTQPAQLRATDVTSGQQQTVNFTIVNNTGGGQSPITVLPGTATITGPTPTTCSTGFRIDYYIYGGNPPYTVASTFPTAVTIVNSTVAASGKFFEAITNGTCVDPLTFAIVDSAGKTPATPPTLSNNVGAAAPVTPTTLVVTPPAGPTYACTSGGSIQGIVVTGGTPPYNVSVNSPASVTVAPAIVAASGDSFAAQFAATLTTGTNVNITVLDSGTPQQTKLIALPCS